MLEIVGDLWQQNGWLVVPVNLSGVFAGGIARQARDRYPDVERSYRSVLWRDLAPKVVLDRRNHLILVPIKAHWRDEASLDMIKSMVQQLARLEIPRARIYLPLLGCGYGNLYAADVLPVLRESLDDRFILVRPERNGLRREYRGDDNNMIPFVKNGAT